MKRRRIITAVATVLVVFIMISLVLIRNSRSDKAEIVKGIYDLKVLQGWWSQYLSDHELAMNDLKLEPTAETLKALAKNSGIKDDDSTLNRLLLAQNRGQLIITYHSVKGDLLATLKIKSTVVRVYKYGRVSSRQESPRDRGQ